MSKFERINALFLPMLTTGISCAGVYLWLTGGGGLRSYIGIVLFIASILLIVRYAKTLHDLPPVKLINSPETDMSRVYMHGALVASFIPAAITIVLFVKTYIDMPNDGISVFGFIGVFITFILFPFFWYPVITYICIFGAGVGMDAYRIWGILLIACFITRTVMQSMCFFATNKRIDYCDSRMNGIVGSMLGTINIIFWLDNLWKVRKFAQIELEKGAAAE